MPGPNEVRRMTPRGDGVREAEVDTQVTGNAARDGFTRVAHRRHPGAPPDTSNDSPFAYFGGGDSNVINPAVGERVYRRPRYYDEE